MSNVTESTNPQNTSSNKYGNYGIILYIIILGVLVLITFVSVIWTRMSLGTHLGWCNEGSQGHGQDGYESSDQDQDSTISMENGVDEATLDECYPKFLCLEAHKVIHCDKMGASTTSLCCSICLGEYMDDEMLRLLPSCGHLYHQKCIDSWLREHPTCPVCRSHLVTITPYQQLHNLPAAALLTNRACRMRCSVSRVY